MTASEGAIDICLPGRIPVRSTDCAENGKSRKPAEESGADSVSRGRHEEEASLPISVLVVFRRPCKDG